MGLFRRADSPYWWYSFTVKGRRYRGSTEAADRATAEAIEAKLRSDVLLGIYTSKKAEMSLDAACGRYMTTHAIDLPSAEEIQRHIDNIAAALGKATKLHEITDNAVAEAVAKWRAKIANGTCNRRLGCLRSILKMARDRWGVEVAMPNWKAHWLREPAPRDRYLTPDDAQRLIDCAAPHLRAPIRFSLLTGVRLSNCLMLDWRQVDMQRREIRFRVKAHTPGGKPHVVPMSSPVVALLSGLGAKTIGPVFTYKGRPVGSFRTAWGTALRKAGIEDFRWHDLRHTAASWMVQEGVPLDVVQSVLGHENIQTTQRYAHRDTEAKRRAVEAAASRMRHATEVSGPQAIDETKKKA